MSKRKRRESPDTLASHKVEKRTRDSSKVIYRDGKPLTDRPPEEIALIWSQHVNPNHPDYNPLAGTANGSGEVGTNFLNEAVEERRQKREGGKSRRGSKGLPEQLIDRLQLSSLSELLDLLDDAGNERIADLRESLNDPINFTYLGMDDRTDPKGRVRYRTAGGGTSVSFKRLKNLLGERQKRLKNPLSEKQ
jgi:hypothetical protein